MRRFCGCQVDVEANFTVVEVEPYHPAVSEEIGGFPHCENRHAAQTHENCRLSPGFVTTEEEDIAALDFLCVAYQADVEYACSNGFAFDSALEFLAVRFIVKYAQPEG
jgi:hypothetical protein